MIQVTGDAEVQTQKVTGTNEVIIKTKTLSVDQRQALNDALVENFGVEEDKITAESISGAVSNEMKRDAIEAVIIATICMLIYIWFRFKDIRFATSAVLALLHDVLVVLTFYAAARWSVGSTFIACMLTIVGYSINATIVIFDRVRENLKVKTNKQSLADLVNLSITQTFTRSINTSLTTVVMVIVLFIMGVSSVRELSLIHIYMPAGVFVYGIIDGGAAANLSLIHISIAQRRWSTMWAAVPAVPNTMPLRCGWQPEITCI